jgi:hypothetical protein
MNEEKQYVNRVVLANQSVGIIRFVGTLDDLKSDGNFNKMYQKT